MWAVVVEKVAEKGEKVVTANVSKWSGLSVKVSAESFCCSHEQGKDGSRLSQIDL
jgi:hypothetical protein